MNGQGSTAYRAILTTISTEAIPLYVADCIGLTNVIAPLDRFKIIWPLVRAAAGRRRRREDLLLPAASIDDACANEPGSGDLFFESQA